MSYPQPQSNDAVNDGGDFFRIKTTLSSPGDIYESEQSSLAFGVGPESDIANVRVCYFDATKDSAPDNTFMTQVTISPTRTFVGRLDANLSQNYSPAGRKGRIFFWSDNIYDPSFRPAGFNNAIDGIQFVQPVLDVIQYFQNAPGLVPARVDKQYAFQNYVTPGGGTYYLVVPYYGRKFCYVNFTNRNATTPTNFGIFGVNYCITQDDVVAPPPYHQQTTIRAPAALATGASATQIITATATGMFDALVFSLTDDGPAPLRIVMSDDMP